ncbi:MAG: arginine--tRNA ligase [Alphaproteobacteria bacterium]|nr:arginine--tRNA ligase [Alphaproteobacteria bacterium]
MNIFATINESIRAIAREQFPAVQLDKIIAEPPKDASHGDIATNAAMVIAAQVGKSPKEIAAHLLTHIKSLESVEKCEIAGPGFINLTLAPSLWQQQVGVILEHGRGYGNSAMGAGKKVNVEYVSANPTGPMHVGHARYIYGDALANLLIKAGYNVTKEYYINDAGGQVDKLADSAYLRYREACGEVIGEIPEGLYPGDYMVPVGEGLKQQFGVALLQEERAVWLPKVRDFAIDAVMEMIKSDLAMLGIHFDVFSSERAITEAGKVEDAIAELTGMGLIYEGVLEPPKGKTPDDWEPRAQTLFKSTEFGDDVDRAVKKSDGSWTYFAPDIAYQRDKIARGFDKLIMLLGVDHGGYVKRLKAAVNALSHGKVDLEVKLCALVKFMRDGEPMKMSKRAGTFVTVREVVEEVGVGVFRFIMLTRKNDMPLDFDFAKVTEQSKDNPVFYVQYAHARCHSIIRNAYADMPEAAARAEKPAAGIFAQFTHPAELALIRLLASWPRMVEQAASAMEPHRIPYFLHEVASAFHGFWNMGNDDLSLRFLQKDAIEKTASRIVLARAVAEVIASGLMVMGVEPLEEMRYGQRCERSPV